MYRFNSSRWRVEAVPADPDSTLEPEPGAVGFTAEYMERNKELMENSRRRLESWRDVKPEMTQSKMDETSTEAAGTVCAASGGGGSGLELERLNLEAKKLARNAISIDDDEENEPKQPPGLLDLPVELFEHLCLFLDSSALMNLKETSPYVSQVVDEALSLSSTQGWKYWKKIVLIELQRPLMLKALRSFDTLVGVRELQAYLTYHNNGTYANCFPGNLKKYTWKDVFLSVNSLRKTLESTPIEKTIMYKIQEAFKNEVRLGFKKKARVDYPEIHTTTCGTLLILDKVPNTTHHDQAHGFVFEDMQTNRRCLPIVRVGERIKYTKFMTLPMGTRPGDFPEKSLPKPVTVMIIGTNLRLILFDTREGGRHLIPLPMPPHLEVHGRMIPMIATYEDWLGVWVNPASYQLYKISIDPETGTPESKLIKNVDLGDAMEQYWRIVLADPNAYMPIFEGPPVPQGEAMEYLPLFSIISPKGKNFSVICHSTDAFDRTTPRFNIANALHPTGKQHYPQTAKIKGQAQGHGVTLFWTEGYIFAMVEVTMKKFIYKPWPRVMFNYPREDLIELVEIISKDMVMVYIGNTNTILVMSIWIEGIPPNWRVPRRFSPTDSGPGDVALKIIRRIELKDYLPSPTTRVKTFNFDFDRGSPYIFCMLDELGTKSAYTYQLMKLGFVDPNAEKEAIAPPRTLPCQYHKYKKVMEPKPLPLNTITPSSLARVKDPKMQALLKAFGVYDLFKKESVRKKKPPTP